MKLFYIGSSLFCSLLCCTLTHAQTALQWQKSLGGKNNEYAYASTPISDGGFIIVGSTNSNNDADVPVSKAFNGAGGSDIWIAKVNTLGEIVWSKTFGGSKDDIATDIIETPDKNILVVATTASVDGDAQGNGTRGGLLLLKLKPDGSVLWRKIFAGGYNVGEIAFVKASAYSKPTLKPTSDGGYIIGANTMPLTNSDFWLAKIKDTGETMWTKTYGTNQNDWMNEVITCADGGYLMIGGTEANANELSGAGKGFIDTYIMKVNAAGNQQWQKALGGANLDEAFSCLQLSDGSFMIVGESNSTDGDFNINLGEKDGFIVKLSGGGSLLWKKQVGGIYSDGLYAIRQSVSGKIYAFGQSSSTFGTIKPKGSSGDVWVTRIDDIGNLSEHNLLGGADVDIARGASATADGGFIIAANSNSVDGDLIQNNGTTDFWIIKVGTALPVTLQSFSASITSEQHVKLSWTSLNETKAKNFVIESSLDLTKFITVGQVNAAGTSTGTKSYTLTDAKPAVGKNYYRLKFYDESNKEYTYKTVSATVSLLSDESDAQNMVSIFPNPVIGSSFYVESANAWLTKPYLLNTQGQTIETVSEALDAFRTRITVRQTFTPGIYFLVFDVNGGRIIKKLIVP